MLLVVAYLVLPWESWRWVSKLFVGLRGVGRVPAYFIDLEFQWLFLAFVCIGIFLHKGRIRDMIGAMWKHASEFWGDFGIGGLFLIVKLMVLVILIAVFPFKHHDHTNFLPRNSVEFLAFAPVAITAGIGEEITCRGYLQKMFRSLTGSTTLAVILQAVVFMLAHGYDQELAGFLEKFLAGVGYGLLANWRKSLLPCMVAHSFTDLFAGLISTL